MRVDGVDCIGYMCYTFINRRYSNGSVVTVNGYARCCLIATVTWAFKVCKVLVSSEMESA